MLVLTRKVNEKIRIGDNVVVTVTQVRGNMVRLGIEAPQDMRIIRGELPHERIPADKPAATEEQHVEG